MIQLFCDSSYVNNLIFISTSPLASNGFAAIGCFRASPYGRIYILMNYSKLTTKKSAIFFFENPNFFCCLKPFSDQDGTNKKNSNRSIRSEGDRFQTQIVVLYIKDNVCQISCIRSRDGVNKTKNVGTNEDDIAASDPVYLRRYEHFPEYYRYVYNM